MNKINNWQIKKLGEVCKTTSGGTPSRRNSDFYNGSIPWVKSGELDKGIILDTEEKITEEAIKNSSAKIFPKGTLLIALYGATIGKLAFLGVDAATNQAVCGIYENQNIISKYLYYFLLFNKPKLVQQGVGGAQPNISQTILKDLDLPLPPLETQQALVSKIEELFSELDKGIAELKTAQQQLKTYRQSVLKSAFEGKLTETWRLEKKDLPSSNDINNKVLSEKETFYLNLLNEWEDELINFNQNNIKKPSKPKSLTIPDKPSDLHNEKKWKIPNNWIWTQLGTICFVTKLAGFEYTEYVKYDDNGDLPVLKAENVGTNGFKYTDFSKVKSESVEKLKRSKLNGGELLIVFVGAGTGNIGAVPTGKYFLGPNIGMARPYIDVNSKYIEYFYQSSNGKSLLMTAVKAVAQPSLSMATIRQAPIPIPSVEEQHRIVQEIESRLSVADKMEQSIQESLQKAEALRQSILKKAFCGELV